MEHKTAKVLATAAGLALMSGGVAHAYTFGVLDVDTNGSVAGQGKGTTWGDNWDQLNLSPVLKDHKTDDMNAYLEARASRATVGATKVQSGRRGDGKDWWMTLITRTSHAGVSISGWSSTTEICLDKAWAFDICGETKTSNL